MKIAIAEWSSSYERSWLKGDLIAGITVSAVLIPSALAHAGIVGVEPRRPLHGPVGIGAGSPR